MRGPSLRLKGFRCFDQSKKVIHGGPNPRWSFSTAAQPSATPVGSQGHPHGSPGVLAAPGCNSCRLLHLAQPQNGISIYIYIIIRIISLSTRLVAIQTKKSPYLGREQASGSTSPQLVCFRVLLAERIFATALPLRSLRGMGMRAKAGRHVQKNKEAAMWPCMDCASALRKGRHGFGKLEAQREQV